MDSYDINKAVDAAVSELSSEENQKFVIQEKRYKKLRFDILDKLTEIIIEYRVLFAVLLLAIIMPFFLRTEASALTYTLTIIIIFKILIFSALIYATALMSDFNNILSFNKCFFAATVIAFSSLIPSVMVLIIVTSLISMLFFNVSLRAASFMIVSVMLLNLIIGLAVKPLIEEKLYDLRYYPKIHNANFGCVSNMTIDQTLNLGIRGNIQLNTGTEINYYHDFCSVSKRLNDKNKIDSCSGRKCYVVKYTCLSNKIVSVIPCPDGCNNGICLSNIGIELD